MNMEWLKGKKTYLICGMSIAGIVAAYLNGTMTGTQAVEAIGAALALASVRSGVTTEVAKAQPDALAAKIGDLKAKLADAKDAAK